MCMVIGSFFRVGLVEGNYLSSRGLGEQGTNHDGVSLTEGHPIGEATHYSEMKGNSGDPHAKWE
jgi:hypothetical protein